MDSMELRHYERVGFLCQLELTPVPGGAPRPGRSLDLSLGGVGAVTQSSFQLGQMVNVAFCFKDSNQIQVRDEVAGRVVRLAADVDVNQIGVQFLSCLTEAEHPRLMRKLMNA